MLTASRRAVCSNTTALAAVDEGGLRVQVALGAAGLSGLASSGIAAADEVTAYEASGDLCSSACSRRTWLRKNMQRKGIMDTSHVLRLSKVQP